MLSEQVSVSTKDQQPDEAAMFQASVRKSLRAGSERMARIELQMAEHSRALAVNTITTQQTARATVTNTEATKALHERTNEMVDVFMAMKGGFRVLGWLGQVFKWAAPIIGAYFALRQAGLNAGWWPFP